MGKTKIWWSKQNEYFCFVITLTNFLIPEVATLGDSHLKNLSKMDKINEKTFIEIYTKCGK